MLVSAVPASAVGLDAPSSAEAGESPDAQSLADEMGWDLATALEIVDQQDRLGELAASLAEAYPDVFAGAWTTFDASPTFYVRFKGEAPETAASAVEDLRMPVSILSDAAYTEIELQERAELLHTELQKLGAETIATTYSIQDQRVLGAASKPPALADLSAEELRQLLPFELWSPDIEVDFEDQAVAGDHTTYGGAQLTKTDLTTLCTTGFSVRNSAGTTGFVTAGHCPSVYRYRDPVDSSSLDPTLIASHIGYWGDMEWHTVPETEQPRFYAGFSDQRPVYAVDQYILAGDSFCGYGRATGYRKCDTVLNTWITCTTPSGTVEKLVAMEDLQFQEGDSGGPWFWNNTAAGIIKGFCNVGGYARDVWSRAMYIDNGLGVYIMISP